MISTYIHEPTEDEIKANSLSSSNIDNDIPNEDAPSDIVMFFGGATVEEAKLKINKKGYMIDKEGNRLYTI